MDICLIAVICIITAIMSKAVQPTNRDIAAVISFSGVIAAALLIVDSIAEALSMLKRAAMMSDINGEYILIAFKVLGICYVCEIASSCCRDCGETALAGVIDIAGRISISLICLPLIEKFIDVVRTILELA